MGSSVSRKLGSISYTDRDGSKMKFLVPIPAKIMDQVADRKGDYYDTLMVFANNSNAIRRVVTHFATVLLFPMPRDYIFQLPYLAKLKKRQNFGIYHIGFRHKVVVNNKWLNNVQLLGFNDESPEDSPTRHEHERFRNNLSSLDTKLEEAIQNTHEYMATMFITLENQTVFEGGENAYDHHAITGVVNYTPGEFTFIMFEPSAREDETSELMIKLMRDYLHRTYMDVKPGEHARITVSYPSTPKGLQESSPVCVQWSAIMLCVYLLNCVIPGKACDNRDLTDVLIAAWEQRKAIMPVWLMFIDMLAVTAKGRSMLNKRNKLDGKPRDRVYFSDPLKLMSTEMYIDNTNSSGTGRLTLKDHAYAGSTDTDIDFADCSSKSRDTCTSPCGYVQDKCLNLKLYDPSVLDMERRIREELEELAELDARDARQLNSKSTGADM